MPLEQDRIIEKLSEIIDSTAKKSQPPTKHSFSYIPLSPRFFISYLQRAIEIWKKNNPDKSINYLKFMDAGCGIGTKILIAQAYGMSTFGIELNKKLYKQCKTYTDQYHSNKIYHQNILNHNYSGYSIIYFYCPFSDADLQIKFEKRIAETCSMGSIIIPIYSRGFFSDNKRFRRIDNLTDYIVERIK